MRETSLYAAFDGSFSLSGLAVVCLIVLDSISKVFRNFCTSSKNFFSFFFYFQDSARISVDPNKLSDFLMTCKKTLKENYDVGSNEYVTVLFSKDKGKLFQVEF